MPGRLDLSGAHTGLIVYFRGKIHDLSLDGDALVKLKGTLYRAQCGEDGSIVNVWI